MTDPKDAPNDSLREFVVETRIKPDGRSIHYYEWPDRPPEPPEAKPAKTAGPKRPDPDDV